MTKVLSYKNNFLFDGATDLYLNTGVPTTFDIVELYRELSTATAWAFGFTISGLDVSRIGTLSTESIFLISKAESNDGIGITLGETGTANLIFTEGETDLVVCSFPMGNASLEVRSTGSGHEIYINGVQIQPSYTTGSASVNLDYVENATWCRINTLGYLISGTITNIFLKKEQDYLEFFPCADGVGNKVRGNILGTEVDISNAYWVPLGARQSVTDMDIFDGKPVDFSATPADGDWALFVDASGVPIKHSGDWSSYASDDLFRNPDCWFSAKAITCFSIWSDISTTHRFPVTLLSPRHFVCNKHVTENAIGSTVVFSDMNDIKQSTTILNFETLSGDIQVGILEDDINLDVAFAAFLPDSFSYNYSNSNSFKTFATNPVREGVLSICDCISFTSGNGLFIGIDESPEKQHTYNWNIVSDSGLGSRTGDSQRPSFIVHGDKLFYLTSQTTSGSMWSWAKYWAAANLSTLQTEIQQAMDDYDTQYSRSPSYELTVGEF